MKQMANTTQSVFPLLPYINNLYIFYIISLQFQKNVFTFKAFINLTATSTDRLILYIVYKY